MVSWKCVNCGLVNYVNAATCRRCALPVQNNYLVSSPNPLPVPPPQTAFAPGYPQSSAPLPMPNPQQENYSRTPAYGEQPLYAYQSPYSHPPLNQTGGVWRDHNNLLVIHKNAFLPDRCVKCNAPTNGAYLHRKLSWINPAWYLLVFAGWLIFLIVYLIIRKTAEVDLGLCDTHRTKRRTEIVIGWFITLAGVVSMVLGLSSDILGLFFLGLLAIIGSIIYVSYAASLITVSRMDDHYVWIKRVNKDFVDSFPGMDRF
jgi:hypothetical protein